MTVQLKVKWYINGQEWWSYNKLNWDLSIVSGVYMDWFWYDYSTSIVETSSFDSLPTCEVIYSFLDNGTSVPNVICIWKWEFLDSYIFSWTFNVRNDWQENPPTQDWFLILVDEDSSDWEVICVLKWWYSSDWNNFIIDINNVCNIWWPSYNVWEQTTLHNIMNDYYSYSYNQWHKDISCILWLM